MSERVLRVIKIQEEPSMASSSFQPKSQSPSTVIRFFKIVLSKSLQAGTLKVPKKFSKKYGDSLPNPVYLKPPDGTQWKIDWSDHDGEILFENGWKEFAAYYSLHDGHLLWFELKESSLFEVHIFDMSGLEIDYPLNDHTDDDFVEILNKPPPRPRKCSKAPLSSPSTTRQLRSATKTRAVERGSQSSKTRQLRSAAKTRDVEKGSQSEETTLEIPVFPSPKRDFFDFFPGTRGFKALKEAQKFSSENPFFIVKIRQTRLTHATLPASFITKYFKNKQQKVKVRFEGKLFPSKLYYDQHNSNARISAGWSRFARASKLQPGDVILFELVDRDDPLFETHIYRAQAFKSPYCGFQSLKAAQNFKSANPSFMIKITHPGLLNQRATIPVAFFIKYFAKKNPNINIRMGSKLLPVKLLYYPSFRTAYISAGWQAFVIASNVKAGDVCIFELINEKVQVLNVHIYRASRSSIL